ncbi:MAG TPA: hypothetical protein VJ508_03230, partial [Saprospiraceae bacterium]|nr:hypothetical protein [Saprospiraceae bacterium]
MKNLLSLLFFSVFWFACSHQEKKAPLFTAIPASYSNLDFINRVTNSDTLNIFKYRNFYNGGGVAIGDINNDGLPDI